MKSNKIELLHATHQTFIKGGLGMLPLTHLEGIIAPDYMGIGTTMDEKMFSPEDLYALVRRQQEQSEGLEIHLKDIQNIHTRISTDVRSAFFADEVFLVVKADEEEIQILLRLSTVFEYVENKWVAIHSHGSKPEFIETEKDTWGIEEWKQKNEELQKLVEERTKELSTSLENLKATQAKLIQSEKLASLGELTAGIAHEIQNPLNFVNNFAEVSAEMLDDMKADLQAGKTAEAAEIVDDLQLNLQKINHHGKRASAIVKGMLEHSRAGDAMNRVSTDLNALADEYLRLAYHGLRAKDSSFNAIMETHFDPDLPKIEVIPQDIGRVLLNLINNAFYAVHQRAVEGVSEYRL